MAETELAVRKDAKLSCSICEGRGWHWGWELISFRPYERERIKTGDPMRLRCPCVDNKRS